jgi:hypothetical protein
MNNSISASNGKKYAAEFILRVEKRHGKEYADKLRSACTEQWKLGNRGSPGDWR